MVISDFPIAHLTATVSCAGCCASCCFTEFSIMVTVLLPELPDPPDYPFPAFPVLFTPSFSTFFSFPAPQFSLFTTFYNSDTYSLFTPFTKVSTSPTKGVISMAALPHSVTGGAGP